MIAGNAVSQLRNDRLPELMSTNWNMICTIPDERKRGGMCRDVGYDESFYSKYQMIKNESLPPAKHT
jgi:hypothetical protein